MYPSLILLPVPQNLFAVLKRVIGPQRTLAISDRISRTILDNVPKRAHSMRPELMSFELKCIERLMPRPWITCFETACAFAVWLSIHGERGRVCIGKRMENGELMMHAWVRTDGGEFFGDSRFETCFDAACSDVASGGIRA